jgi:hypothetical protein
MFQRAIRSVAFLSVAALVSGACALEASTKQTDRFNIPFAFQVQNEHTTLPAGVYRIEGSGSTLVFLVNTMTGKRVELLRSAANRSEGKVKLVFDNKDNIHSLREIL